MAYFPLFIDISKKNVLVVGGGKVGTRKVKNLLPFTKNITIVSPRITKELEELVRENNLKWIKRRFRPIDLKEKDIVVVAVNDLKLQKRIYELCQKKRILCNAVDSPDYCNFIFPSLIRRGNLVIGISTSGRIPALSRTLREKLDKFIPENIEEIMKKLEKVRRSEKGGTDRQKKLLYLARKFLQNL